MTHQQKNTSTTRNKDKNSGHGKNKQNNFRLSLPGKSNIYGITSNWITLQKKYRHGHTPQVPAVPAAAPGSSPRAPTPP